MSNPSKALKDVSKLTYRLQIEKKSSQTANQTFSFKAPEHFIEQIESHNPDDPLLKQIFPDIAEKIVVPGYGLDPVGDLNKNPIPSLIHKYHGRVLLIASPKCDIHCRYCFRRHFPYEKQSNRHYWHQALDYIKNDNSIHEVILSGGDPMSLSEKVLLELCQKIERIPHIQTIRIHSRTPVVSPAKAAQKEWLAWAENSRLKKVLVIHCNHANELSDESKQLHSRYRQANIHLLNQSVLLKGVNDSVDSLVTLSHKLFDQSVLPYYLHQLDKVAGAAHFQVTDERALKIHKELRQRLPGYLVPKLVQEVAGEPYKTPL